MSDDTTPEARFCTTCGAALPPGSAACPSCGAAVAPSEAGPAPDETASLPLADGSPPAAPGGVPPTVAMMPVAGEGGLGAAPAAAAAVTEPPARGPWWRNPAIWLGAVAVLAVLGLVVFLLTRDDGGGETQPTTVPTTVAPTSTAPTTVPATSTPTTVAPTTVAPTTVAPTTVAPTTVAPTTVAPTTTVAATTTTAPGSEYIGTTFPNGRPPAGVTEVDSALVGDTDYAVSHMQVSAGDQFWLLRTASKDANGSVTEWEVTDVVAWPAGSAGAQSISGASVCEVAGTEVPVGIVGVFPPSPDEWLTDPLAVWRVDTDAGRFEPASLDTRCQNEGFDV